MAILSYAKVAESLIISAFSRGGGRYLATKQRCFEKTSWAKTNAEIKANYSLYRR